MLAGSCCQRGFNGVKQNMLVNVLFPLNRFDKPDQFDTHSKTPLQPARYCS
jgi:hypothetical protein